MSEACFIWYPLRAPAAKCANLSICGSRGLLPFLKSLCDLSPQQVGQHCGVVVRVIKVNVCHKLWSKSTMRLFIGLCVRKPSLVGWAMQLCALLTDWNIPHRRLASRLQDSWLSGENTFDNRSPFINWRTEAVNVWIFCTLTGQFNILYRLLFKR